MPTYMVAIWSTQQLRTLKQEFSASDAPATTPLTFQQLQPGSPEETCSACGAEGQCSSMAWSPRRVMDLGPINCGDGHLLNFLTEPLECYSITFYPQFLPGFLVGILLSLNINVRELMMVSWRARVPGKQAGVWNEKIGCQNEMEWRKGGGVKLRKMILQFLDLVRSYLIGVQTSSGLSPPWGRSVCWPWAFMVELDHSCSLRLNPSVEVSPRVTLASSKTCSVTPG